MFISARDSHLADFLSHGELFLPMDSSTVFSYMGSVNCDVTERSVLSHSELMHDLGMGLFKFPQGDCSCLTMDILVQPCTGM